MEYSHDDPDQPIGYWAERWAEFKRLWLLSWREPDTKPTHYLAGAMFCWSTHLGSSGKILLTCASDYSAGDQKDDMNHDDTLWGSGEVDPQEGPYEYPALDDEPGFWVEQSPTGLHTMQSAGRIGGRRRR